MDDGRWRTTITTTQQSNSAWETEEEDGVSDEQQRIPQPIRRDYDWGKEEGLHLLCKSEGGMDVWSRDLMLPSDYKVRMVYSPLLQTSRWGLRHVAIT